MENELTNALNLLTVGQLREALGRLDQLKAIYVDGGTITKIFQFPHENGIAGDYVLMADSRTASFESNPVGVLNSKMVLRRLLNDGLKDELTAMPEEGA